MIFPLNHPYALTNPFNITIHPGCDYAPIPAGTRGVQCFSPENSIVVASSFIAALEGNYVVLMGDSGMFYYFGHFETRLVSLNDRVKEGQPIGILGMTGQATGIHTHHEVRRTRSGDQIDPEMYYKDNKEDYMFEGKSAAEWAAIAKDGDTWKPMAQYLSFQPAYPAMGGTPGKPLTDPSGIGVVLADYEKIKQASTGSFKPYDGPELFKKGDA